MKAKSIIELGYEAGSLYCGICDYNDDGDCDIFYDYSLCRSRNEKGYWDRLRCQPCLDSEVKDEPKA